MRIGIDASRAFVDQPTGTERYAFEVITRMLHLPEIRKHEVYLYVKKSQAVNTDGCTNVKVVEIPLRYLWTQAGLAARTWADHLDVLWVPAHTLPALRRPGIRTIVTIHGIEYEWLPAFENKFQRWYLPMSTKYAVSQADRIIAVSEFTKGQLVERLGGREERISVVYEGFDVSQGISGTSRDSKSDEKLLTGYGLWPRKYLLFVGTVQPRKNLERLIEAFSKLRAGDKKLKLVIAGKLGWNYTGVLAAPEKWGVKDRVTLLGYVDDYTRQVLLKNALVYIQPSITEGFGLPVLEAFAAGIPVAASNGGALAEIAGNAGLLFNPDDTGAMIKMIEMVIKSQKVRQELVEKGQKRLRLFGWERAARQTLKLIVSINPKTL